MSNIIRIGIDVGGVILQYDPNFCNLDTCAFVKDALIIIKEIMDKGYDTYIVSFCSLVIENKVRKILIENKCPIPEDKWIFTRTRKEKSDICIKYELNALIDDTLQIHQYLLNDCPNVYRLWFSGNIKDKPKHKHHILNNWLDTKQFIFENLPIQKFTNSKIDELNLLLY